MITERHINQRHLRAATLLLLTSAASALHAEYPDRLIRAIVPFSPGGTTDLNARLISPHLAKALGQQIVVENRPGASGNIGIEAVAKSAPDGYTLLFSATASTQNPALYRRLRFDPLADIQPVGAIAEYPYSIVVNNVLPAKALRDLIALARRKPGMLNAAAGGIGTRLSVELFKHRNHLQAVVINYGGSGQAALSVATGETQLAIMDASPFAPFLASRRVRLLAVAAQKRLPLFPDVPTTAEAGLPDFAAGALAGVYVAGRTPAAIVQKLNSVINTIVMQPDVNAQLRRQGGAVEPRSVEALTQWYRAEIAKWKDIVARAGIPPVD